MTLRRFVSLLLLTALAATAVPANAQQPPQTLAIQPGDTWAALSLRFQTSSAALHAASPYPNQLRQPIIGSVIILPDNAVERSGRFTRSAGGGLLELAIRNNLSPWLLAATNDITSPYRPLLERPLLVPGDDVPRELPPGFESLALTAVPARPGEALGMRGRVIGSDIWQVWLRAAGQDAVQFGAFQNGANWLALAGTGAFFPPGAHDLDVLVEGRPFWTQPWQMAAGDWTFDELTLTGEAAAIDAAAIAEERARLLQLWTAVTPEPQWTAPFQLPIDEFLTYSSAYGARRSYNGGPVRSYHEGVDFSAYGGAPVYAPARGTVALAEQLYVRGGAVIIDHGLGIFSGTYHLSAVHAELGQTVEPGDLIGEVGTTGLSTGNHLHWDLLVGGTWVDGRAWLEAGTGCWVLEAWGRPCQNRPSG